MKYIPREPAEGINVSDTHPLAEAGVLVVGVSLIFGIGATVLFFLVDLLVALVSVETEAELFDSWLPEDIAPIETEDERHAAVSELLGRLVEHIDDTPYTFRIAIDATDEPNAMAFPGGLIVVTQGLLNSVESENELAFVLAHELGHFENRDHLRMLGRAVLFSVFVQSVIGGDGLAIGVTDLASRGFSRGQESEADATALALLHREYGHVADATAFFQRLQTSGSNLSRVAAYASTHPAPATRVADLQALAEANGWRSDGEVRSLDVALGEDR